MEFPDLEQAKENITNLFFAEQEMAAEDVCVIASPYRICPLGAHIDHQGGPVLGLSLIHISEPTRPAPLSRMPSSA